MRIAIFGGTFDPIHRGHLQIARHVARTLHLDRVLFVTAARPPHKTGRELAAAANRHAMVALALRREKKFIPCNVELLSASRKNYSVNTVARIRARLRPSDELFFIMGADQLAEFNTWRSVDRLLASIAFVVVSRPGLSFERMKTRLDPKVRQALHALTGTSHRPSAKISAQPPAVYLLPGLRIGISSSSIRARIAARKTVRHWLDREVWEYIQKCRLYRQSNKNSAHQPG